MSRSFFTIKSACIVILGTALSIGQCWGQTVTITAKPSQALIDSVGVNTHLPWKDSSYYNYPLFNSSIKELGVRHIRDEITWTDPAFLKEVQVLGRMGITLCGGYDGGGRFPDTTLDSETVLSTIVNLQPNLDAVECTNERDAPSYKYNGQSFPQGLISEATDFWKIVKSDPKTRSLPVLMPSMGNAADYKKIAEVGPDVNYADYGNMHSYQGGSIADDSLERWWIPYSKLVTGSRPIWATEMGYHNYTKYLDDGEQQGVSQRASALYLPIAFCEFFNRGIMRTYSYQFMDGYPDPKVTDPEQHFGLLNNDWSPKPAFTALKNMLALLDDSGKPFTTGSLAIQFTGAPATMHYTLLQKSDGNYYLELWNDVQVYRIATKNTAGADLYPAEVPVQLTFAGPHLFTVYAPNDTTSTHPTSQYTLSKTPRSIELNVPAKLLILKITPYLLH